MSKYEGRTTKILQFRGNIWPIVDEWAQNNECVLTEQEQNSRTYQRGAGNFAPANMYRISWDGSNYALEAWLYFGKWLRVHNLFIFPEEVIIDGGGTKGRPARNKAKNHANQLLQALGEPRIQ